MREQVINGLTRWVNGIIDNIAPDNFLFALISGPIKRVAGQYLEDSLDFNIIKPFIVARDGSVDARQTIEEVMASLKAMPKKKMKWQGITLEVGNGVVVIELPDNHTISQFTDGLTKITLTETDFLQLAEYINEN